MIIKHVHEVNINFSKLQIEIIDSVENQNLKTELAELKKALAAQTSKLDESGKDLQKAIDKNS